MEISLKRIIGITLTSFLVGAIGSCTLVYNPKPYKITESIIEDKKYLIIHYIDNFSPKEVIESDQIFTQQQDGRFYRWNLVKETKIATQREELTQQAMKLQKILNGENK